MKYVHIKNSTPAPVFFIYCTKSSCTCATCLEWIQYKSTPIADWPGATYGSVRIDAFAERVDRLCPNWDYMGTFRFDIGPLGLALQRVTRAMLVDYDKQATFSVLGSGVHVNFTYSGAVVPMDPAIKNLKYANTAVGVVTKVAKVAHMDWGAASDNVDIS